MQLLVGTSNKGKFIEIGESLRGLNLELLQPEQLRITEDPDETGTTFAENALLKARHYFERGKIPSIADDSGIVVDALQDELGVQTRRWGAGPDASDQEWIEYFLDRMSSERNRSARFICTLAYIDKNGMEYLFEGTCNGIITPTLEAGFLPGLPISACFRPEGYDRVYSAMSIEEKNAVSHRGKAAAQLKKHLSESLVKHD